MFALCANPQGRAKRLLAHQPLERKHSESLRARRMALQPQFNNINGIPPCLSSDLPLCLPSGISLCLPSSLPLYSTGGFPPWLAGWLAGSLADWLAEYRFGWLCRNSLQGIPSARGGVGILINVFGMQRAGVVAPSLDAFCLS